MVDDWIKSSEGVSESQFEEMDEFFETLAETAVSPDDIMHQGMPWGGLHEMLLEKEYGYDHGKNKLVPRRMSFSQARVQF